MGARAHPLRTDLLSFLSPLSLSPLDFLPDFSVAAVSPPVLPLVAPAPLLLLLLLGVLAVAVSAALSLPSALSALAEASTLSDLVAGDFSTSSAGGLLSAAADLDLLALGVSALFSVLSPFSAFSGFSLFSGFSTVVSFFLDDEDDSLRKGSSAPASDREDETPFVHQGKRATRTQRPRPCWRARGRC